MGRDLPPPPTPDDGAADPRLTAALAAGNAAAVAAALVGARLIVGVLALPGEQAASEGEMALALLESSTGARALPAFTSLASLASWRPDARPVPRSAVELAGAVRTEDLAALVVDVAGPVPWTVRGADLAALASGYVPAGEQLAARRSEGRVLAPSWEAGAALRDACRGLEVYALDVALPERPAAPALGLVPPAGVAPAPLAERLLLAAGRDLDLVLLDGTWLTEARRLGRPLGGSDRPC